MRIAVYKDHWLTFDPGYGILQSIIQNKIIRVNEK